MLTYDPETLRSLLDPIVDRYFCRARSSMAVGTSPSYSQIDRMIDRGDIPAGDIFEIAEQCGLRRNEVVSELAHLVKETAAQSVGASAGR